MSLQIFAVKEEMSFNRPQLRELSLNAFYQKSTCATEGAEKPINTSSTPGIFSTIYSLDYAKSSRLVSESPDKFSPLTQNRISTVLTFIEYIVD